MRPAAARVEAPGPDLSSAQTKDLKAVEQAALRLPKCPKPEELGYEAWLEGIDHVLEPAMALAGALAADNLPIFVPHEVFANNEEAWQLHLGLKRLPYDEWAAGMKSGLIDLAYRRKAGTKLGQWTRPAGANARRVVAELVPLAVEAAVDGALLLGTFKDKVLNTLSPAETAALVGHWPAGRPGEDESPTAQVLCSWSTSGLAAAR
jgi:hypothetical protein